MQGADRIPVERCSISSWGRGPLSTSPEQHSIPCWWRDAVWAGYVSGKVLPYGNGRSYGDSCLNPGGTLLLTRGLDRFVSFDELSGTIDCEAGVLLSEIIDLILPAGWFLPVTPGTRFVTVGGAIANDVHGKNHAMAGSFGEHVLDFDLLRSDGSTLRCSTNSNPDKFRATIGGLGLTGVILRARIRLRRVNGPGIEFETRRFGGLRDFFSLSQATQGSEYRVAWVDCLARGAALGRGVYTHGGHSTGEATAVAPPRIRFSMPFVPPFSLVNRTSLRLFNSIYYHQAPVRPTWGVCHYRPFFYPLDGIAHWNRMYGPKGFLQYQCVVPKAGEEDALTEILGRIVASGQGSFLGVLKQFGERRVPGMMSFPRVGTTLALDFPFLGQSTLRLLDELDRVVMSAGGAVYPAKDARMSPAMFAASFPDVKSFAEHVDPAFSSGFWRRVMGQR